MKNFKTIIISLVLVASFVNLLSYIENDNILESNKKPKVGDTAPEISLKSPTGEEISLSSLRGKVVLVDFWAAWCPPCRGESPYLAAAYSKFKDSNFAKGKGFTIYSVSLDKDKSSWVKAIAKDQLEWENHVSDLKYWNSSVVNLYKINSIPTNYLLDENGKIIATNLRRDALENYLKKIEQK